MNEAIKLVIEKGELFADCYDIEFLPDAFSYRRNGKGFAVPYSDILLDPLFWQALGKALGWRYCRLHSFTGSESEAEMCQDCLHDEWVKKWHRFIDWIAEGKNCDEFFKDLIRK